MDEIQINTIKQLVAQFPDEKSCRDYWETKRWGDNPICPHCGSAKKPYTLKAGKFNNIYKCSEKECAMRFNCLTGSIFDNTKLPLIEWFKAIYIATSHKKGISSCQLGRDLGIAQKSAWYMLQRIREMMREKAPERLGGTVEIDETYVGGKMANKHSKERKKWADSGKDNKTPVLGMIERDGKVILKPMPNAQGETILPIISDNLEKKTVIMTDGSNVYIGLGDIYTSHESVNHSAGEYARGNAHTNSIEGFFSILKRGIYGIYHHASPKHLSKYCDEFSFRYNMRKDTQTERFNAALQQNYTRLKYRDLTRKEAKK